MFHDFLIHLDSIVFSLLMKVLLVITLLAAVAWVSIALVMGLLRALVFMVMFLSRSYSIRAYVPTPDQDPKDAQKFFEQTDCVARQFGFQRIGTIGLDPLMTRQRAYRSLWLSQDGRTLLIAFAARIRWLPAITRIALVNRLAGGRVVATQTEEGPGDTCGSWDLECLPKADLSQLWAYHRSRLQSETEAPCVVTATQGIAAYQAIVSQQEDEMAEMGLIRFVDSTRHAYRYTVRGAASESRGDPSTHDVNTPTKQFCLIDSLLGATPGKASSCGNPKQGGLGQ